MPTQTHLGNILRGRDIFLCHTRADKPWVEMLAERIESVPYQDRHLGVIFDKWDFTKGKNVVLEIDETIDQCRFIGLIISKAMLAAEWPTMERTIAVWSDPSGRQGRVLPLLIENVDLPPSLRIRNWIDFRDPDRFEESFIEIIGRLRDEPIRRGRGGLHVTLPATTPYAPAPVVIGGSNGPDLITEQLVTNLLPVTNLPTVVQVATTPLREKKHIKQYTKREDVPPFILREGCLFTFSDLHDNDNPLQTAIDSKSLHDEPFPPWFLDEDQRRWAIELLNLNLREYAWQRYLRFDRKGLRFFFTPKKNGPKTISWTIAGTKHDRHVTTRHYAYHTNEQGEKEKFEYGWRHQALRASFLRLPNGLFLKLTPTYMLTKEDGKTPRGGRHVGPILNQWLNQERNGQVLRSLRFWSLVLTRGLEKQCRVGIAQYDREQQADDEDEEDSPSDVVEELDENNHDEEEGDQEEGPSSTARGFRRGLKAACMHLLPTQLLWHRTLAGTKGVQDLATRAWNLSVALLYKARVIPWRLADVMDGSCFVGVSFFHPDGQPSTTRTSIAQAFTHTGEGFVLQGDNFTWQPSREERSPHLDHDGAAALMKQVLDVYEEEVHALPQRLIIHKTSRYTAAEVKGFTSELRGVRDYALVTLSRRGICCLRPGNKPALRGTVIDFGEKKGLVYTVGYVPFLRCYPGFRVPQPLEITENHGSQTFHDVATDVLRLTKLNWNTAAFCCADPITIAFSRRVGDILKIANTDHPAREYRQYM